MKLNEFSLNMVEIRGDLINMVNQSDRVKEPFLKDSDIENIVLEDLDIYNRTERYKAYRYLVKLAGGLDKVQRWTGISKYTLQAYYYGNRVPSVSAYTMMEQIILKRVEIEKSTKNTAPIKKSHFIDI